MADAVELSIRILPLDHTLQEELGKLMAEGWRPVPNLTPAATYVMLRTMAQPEATQAQPEPAAAGLGKLTIDETKVHVYRNGRLLEIGEEGYG